MEPQSATRGKRRRRHGGRGDREHTRLLDEINAMQLSWMDLHLIADPDSGALIALHSGPQNWALLGER